MAMKTLPLVIAAIAATTLCTPAFASDTASRTVDVRPGELASHEGRQDVEQRLQSAARVVCREHGLRGLDRRSAETRCREEALQAALNSLYGDQNTVAHAPSRHAQMTLAASQR